LGLGPINIPKTIPIGRLMKNRDLIKIFDRLNKKLESGADIVSVSSNDLKTVLDYVDELATRINRSIPKEQLQRWANEFEGSGED
jgi:hypothetical protein